MADYTITLTDEQDAALQSDGALSGFPDNPRGYVQFIMDNHTNHFVKQARLRKNSEIVQALSDDKIPEEDIASMKVIAVSALDKLEIAKVETIKP
jgi:hypothetical protein